MIARSISVGAGSRCSAAEPSATSIRVGISSWWRAARLLKPLGKGAQVVGDRLLGNVLKAPAQLPRYSELAATFNGYGLARKLLRELLFHAHASGPSSVALV
jgi:hypothetical protein